MVDVRGYAIGGDEKVSLLHSCAEEPPTGCVKREVVYLSNDGETITVRRQPRDGEATVNVKVDVPVYLIAGGDRLTYPNAGTKGWLHVAGWWSGLSKLG